MSIKKSKFMNNKIKFRNVLMFIATLCFLAACNTKPDSGNGEKNAKSPDGKTLKAIEGSDAHYGGFFRMNETEYFRSLYPHNIGEVVGHRITNQLYEGLVRLDQATLQIKPSLAKEWTVNETATVYTFKLRKGVKFHDDACFKDEKGREVTAKDFKYCLDLLCTENAQNKGFDFVKGRIKGVDAYNDALKKGNTPTAGVEGVKVLDEHTLQIELEQAFSSFLQVLAMPFGHVFPKEAVDKYGLEMRIKAVGTGPFYLKALRENETVLLLRNPDYWDKDANGNQLPYLDGIRWSFMTDEMSSLLAFKQGDLDMIYRLPLKMASEIVDQNGTLKGEYTKFQYQEKPSMDLQYYGFLNTEKPFNDKRVRQAFCYAIDREKIVRYVLNGAGVPGHYGIAPPAFSNYDARGVKGYTFNPEKARQLLSEAGYPGGKGLEGLSLQLNAGGGRNVQVAESVQKMLQENLNIPVEITQMPWSQHLETIESAKAKFFRAGWIADYPDPENFLTLLWSRHLPDDDKGHTYLNTFRYRSKDYDRLFEQALRTIDDKSRNDLFKQADQTAINDAPFLPLYHSKDQRLLQPDVRNYPQNGMEYRNLRDVYFVPVK